MRKPILFLSMVLILIITSCIKEPPPLHIQANILEVTVNDDAYVQTNREGFNYTLVFSEQVDQTRISPIFTLSEGATITPASGEPQDFTNPVTYRVVSESGNELTYTVSILGNISLIFDFENWAITNPIAERPNYGVPQSGDPLWASTNHGVAVGLGIINFGVFPELDEFPTLSTTDSYTGNYAAKLTTIRGGTIIGIQRIPFIPGNLYRGEYVFNLSDPQGSLRFGVPHPANLGKPITFKGFYKYQPGEDFYGLGEVIDENRVDEFNLYAVIFKVQKGAAGAAEFLDGHSIRTPEHPDFAKIVGTAFLDDRSPKSEYTAFEIDFTYTEEIDFVEHDYKLTVVALSSAEAATYEAAPGSTLIIDDLEIITDLFAN